MKLVERFFEIQKYILDNYGYITPEYAHRVSVVILKIESNVDGYIGVLEENDDLREKILELEIENKRLIQIIEETKTAT